MNTKYAVLFLCILGFIVYLSSVPSLRSGFTKETDQILRKTAHIVIYAALAFSLWKALPGLEPRRGIKLLVSCMIALGIALLDETHQLFVPGRHGNLTGFSFDCIGVGIGVVLGRMTRHTQG